MYVSYYVTASQDNHVQTWNLDLFPQINIVDILHVPFPDSGRHLHRPSSLPAQNASPPSFRLQLKHHFVKKDLPWCSLSLNAILSSFLHFFIALIAVLNNVFDDYLVVSGSPAGVLSVKKQETRLFLWAPSRVPAAQCSVFSDEWVNCLYL